MDTFSDWTYTIVKLILQLEVNNLATRREVYEAAYQAQNVFIEQNESTIEVENIIFIRKQLRYTISAIETDIRSGIDISAEGYTPTGLKAINEALENERAIRLQRRVSAERRSDSDGGQPLQEDGSQNLSAPDLKRLKRLEDGLAAIDRVKRGNDGRGSPVANVRALLIQNLLLIRSESRIALVWTLLLPSVMIGIISLLYLLTGTTYVLGMDVPTFAVLGSITWVMARQVIFRVSGSYAHHRMWIHIPLINSLQTTFSTALVTLITFSVVYVTILTIGYHAGLTTLPNSYHFVFPLIGMWLFAYGVGLVFGVIASYWEYFLRFAGAIERLTQIFSSMMFVSEQLPETWKPYVLWLPTAHGMQLVRAGYFASYSAPDASRIYFAEGVAGSLVAGVMMIWLGRARLEPL